MCRKDNSLIFFLVFMTSCSGGSSKVTFPNDSVDEYSKKAFSQYSVLYKAINDSLSNWIKDSLSTTKNIYFDNSYRVDSALSFNKDSTRFFTTVNYKNVGFKNSKLDDIMEFGGAKIKGKWYFFFIARTMAVPREFYKEDIYEPLTFEELSALSHREIIGHYIKKRDDGSFVPNDEAFKQLFVDEWYCGDRPCKSTAERDSIILLYNAEKYKYKLDPKEIIEIKQEMANSVRPPAPQKKWWKLW